MVKHRDTLTNQPMTCPSELEELESKDSQRFDSLEDCAFGDLALLDDNAQTLRELSRALTLSEGFALFFARANLPLLRDTLISKLTKSLRAQDHMLRRLSLQPGDSVLRVLLTTQEAGLAGKSMHVCDLERLMPHGTNHPLVLGHLNFLREHFRRLECPVVFWVQDAALTRLAREAPDFWAWRSGVFEFVPEPALTKIAYETLRKSGPSLAWEMLPSPMRCEKLAALENLVEDYRALGNGKRERRALAELLLKIGETYPCLDRWDEATCVLMEAQTLFRQVGDRLGEANVYREMGRISLARDDFKAARDYLDQAVALHALIEDRYSEAGDRFYRADVLMALDAAQQAREDLTFALEVFKAMGLPYADWVAEKLEALA